jgi:hypothetical protein
MRYELMKLFMSQPFDSVLNFNIQYELQASCTPLCPHSISFEQRSCSIKSNSCPTLDSDRSRPPATNAPVQRRRENERYKVIRAHKGGVYAVLSVTRKFVL